MALRRLRAARRRAHCPRLRHGLDEEIRSHRWPRTRRDPSRKCSGHWTNVLYKISTFAPYENGVGGCILNPIKGSAHRLSPLLNAPALPKFRSAEAARLPAAVLVLHLVQTRPPNLRYIAGPRWQNVVGYCKNPSATQKESTRYEREGRPRREAGAVLRALGATDGRSGSFGNRLQPPTSSLSRSRTSKEE